MRQKVAPTISSDLPRLRQSLNHISSRQHLGTTLPAVLIWIDGFLIAQFKDISRLFAEMDVAIHHFLQHLDVLNPFVFDGVGQATEDIVAILHAPGEGLVYFVVLGAAVN